ncbi:TetR/AcrR family transcriptional regulator [Martelella limonii]|uniref:TetR/AcrR family transcriptional regulator n=1 Tax=Martelella limonii TaxID=1647649 RepID=UPI00158059D3|nr:TetR/AcrR family transcriptional regulator [Martelella limonii]
MPTKKMTRAEQKALRPIQILDAAFEEFVLSGFVATRVEDIAQRIGVTKGTIYVYFPTKEDLFSAMIRHISRPVAELLEDFGDLEGSCTERLKAMLRLAYQRVTQDRMAREHLRLVISEGARFPEVIDAHHAELIQPLLSHTQALLDEGIAAGEFRDCPGASAEIVIAPILSLIMNFLIFDSRRSFDLPNYIDAHLDLLLGGIAT